MISLNLNLLETNIINLSVVIGFLIYIGGDLLKSILKARRESIFNRLKSLQEDVDSSLSEQFNAEHELASAKDEAFKIRDQMIGPDNSAILDRMTILYKYRREEKERLKQAYKINLRIEEDKILKKLCIECGRQALIEAKNKVQEKLKANPYKDGPYKIQHKLIANNLYILKNTR